MTPDIAAARQQAEFVIRLELIMSDREVEVARALLWLTDPTPLTWEIVCEQPGGELIADGWVCVFGDVQVTHHDGRLWFLRVSTGTYLQFPPRTLGELRQLMLRTNGTSQTKAPL